MNKTGIVKKNCDLPLNDIITKQISIKCSNFDTFEIEDLKETPIFLIKQMIKDVKVAQAP